MYQFDTSATLAAAVQAVGSTHLSCRTLSSTACIMNLQTRVPNHGNMLWSTDQ